MCGKNLDGWDAGDEAWEEHCRHAPHCPLVRLDVEPNRVLTFTSSDLWPHAKCRRLTATSMAKAGFFFWPKGPGDDTAVCFQCGLALDGWETEDDPKHEHGKRRPECPFIRSGISLRPCSYQFILACKPDRNAITHISASSKPNTNVMRAPSAPKMTKGGSTAAEGSRQKHLGGNQEQAQRHTQTPMKVKEKDRFVPPAPMAFATPIATRAANTSKARKSSIIPQVVRNESIAQVDPILAVGKAVQETEEARLTDAPALSVLADDNLKVDEPITPMTRRRGRPRKTSILALPLSTPKSGNISSPQAIPLSTPAVALANYNQAPKRARNRINSKESNVLPAEHESQEPKQHPSWRQMELDDDILQLIKSTSAAPVATPADLTLVSGTPPNLDISISEFLTLLKEGAMKTFEERTKLIMLK